MPDIFGELYACFAKLAEDPQEPIDLKPLPDLLKNEIEMISQTRYFFPQQVDMMLADAAYDIRILSLPNVGAMSLEELERAWRVRMVVYYVQDDPQIQRRIASLLPPDIPNQRKLYDCLVFLNRELRFALKCKDEIIKRIQSDPVALNTLGFVEFECDPVALHKFGFGKDIARQFLTKKLKQATRRLPCPVSEDEREELIADFLGIRTAELKQMPYYQRLADFGKTIISVKRDIIDELKSQQTKFERSLVSYNQEVEHANGSRISMLDILTTEHKSLQTQPEEIEEEFTQEQRQQLEQLLGKTGLEIFEYRHRHTEIIGRGEKKIIAQALRIAESTVGRYIGTNKRIGIFEEKADEIRKILS